MDQPTRKGTEGRALATPLPKRVLAIIVLVSVAAVAAGLYLWGVRDESVYLGVLALVALYEWVFLSH